MAESCRHRPDATAGSYQSAALPQNQVADKATAMQQNLCFDFPLAHYSLLFCLLLLLLLLLLFKFKWGYTWCQGYYSNTQHSKE
jgi:hypothetical protein